MSAGFQKKGDAEPRRYLSENNVNIGRPPTLGFIWSDAVVLICIREPASQVVSLKTQHDRFLAMHAQDGFALSYMEWSGHYDFGGNFEPIDFAEAGDTPVPAEPDHGFWLRYWVDAYRSALAGRSASCHFVCYEKLLADGPSTLARLAETAGIANPEGLLASVGRLRTPTSGSRATGGLPQELYAADCPVVVRSYSRAVGLTGLSEAGPEPVGLMAETVAEVVGFDGFLSFDMGKPDGTPRKLLDVYLAERRMDRDYKSPSGTLQDLCIGMERAEAEALGYCRALNVQLAGFFAAGVVLVLTGVHVDTVSEGKASSCPRTGPSFFMVAAYDN